VAPPGTVIGRDYERAALVAALRRGGSAVVTGATGIGKTFLAAAVSAELASRGHRVLQVLATAAIRDIPLGALAPLLPAPPQIQDGTTLAAAREAILAGAPAGLVLVIDDAHQLDGVSAALIQQLVGTGRVVALLVTRVLDMLPDPAAALASAAGTVQVAVFPLSEDDCAALAETELGGQLDSTTAARLYQLSGGVPLVLRELIRLILASGAITARRGVWSLTGRVPADTGLAHLVSVRLDELSAAQREAAEAVALAEPVELAVLERFTDQLAAEQLETLGLLVTSGEDDAETLRIAHPLYAELLLAGLPRTRRRRLAQALVEACEAAGGLDPVRLALLRLSAGLASPPGALTGAGVIAGQHDRPLAERLLRAAVRAGGGVPARLALARQLALPSPEEALELLAGLREADISPAEAIAVQITRAMALILGSGRPDEVLAELGDVARQPAPIQLVAAFAHLFAGTGPAAIAIAGPVLADERMPRPLRQRAALCLAAGLTGTGSWTRRSRSPAASPRPGLPCQSWTRISGAYRLRCCWRWNAAVT
jgi:AAA ATPase domain